MNLSKNFDSKEFACHCGCGFNTPAASLIEILQAIRDKWGKPIVITSGCRCLNYNRKIGSNDSSKHVTGQAADIAPVDRADRGKLIRLIEDMIKNGELPNLGGFGYKTYTNGCIHVDVFKAPDGHLRRW